MHGHTDKIVVDGAKAAKRLARILVEQSASFTFEPLPDDKYRFTYKPEVSHIVKAFNIL